MSNAVSKIIKTLSAPDSTTKKDWEVIETQMETALPSDYKELIDPRLPKQALRPGGLTDYTTEANETMWEIEAKPPELQIQGSFVIPWATTDNGENLFWRCLPGQHPDEWTVLVNQGRDWMWEYHKMSCTEFLHSTLKKKIQSEILSDDFPLRRHVFRGFNPVPSSAVRHTGMKKPKRILRERLVRNGIPRTRAIPHPQRS
ncbi:hypothetical protein N7532_011258 [Penicillium argentinense]|uniref:Uncharacterized protein n=1 Tax=Penicillium argentinense TaxID=1131581 RepID=A0A9W9JUS5_9EURO|nr:uncharacterized protein N7532_011258 [Penicillium argentinense]KAJ5082215.1 hypothetical protein N7532_011258 [Penicillium argentinense]